MENCVVFVVDDDPGQLKAVSRTLAGRSWEVRAFGSPEAFLDAFDPGVPGCILLDLRMPGVDGLAVQERLAAMGSKTPVIFVTAYGDVPSAVSAMRSGAVDFLEKPFSTDQLLGRIEHAIEQDQKRRRTAEERALVEKRLALLTPREREVLDHVLAGEPNKRIAATLGIAQRTVEVHRRHIMRKMQADTGIQLARIVLTRRTRNPIPKGHPGSTRDPNRDRDNDHSGHAPR